MPRCSVLSAFLNELCLVIFMLGGTCLVSEHWPSAKICLSAFVCVQYWELIIIMFSRIKT